jgi:hypothetical protein
MGRYSKLFGAATGVLVGQVLSAFIPQDQADSIGRALELLLPILGTYLAPANSSRQSA